VWSEVVVPSAESVEISVCDNLLAGELAEAALESSEEPLDPAVLPRSERSGALVTDSQDREADTHERRREEGLVVRAQGARPSKALDGIEQEAEDGDRGFALEMSQSHAETGAMVEDAQKCRRFLPVIREEREVEAPDDIAGSGLGLRDRISRRCSRISRWLSRTTLATKLLPTVIPLRSSQRWLKVCAMERHPAWGINARRRMTSLRTQGGRREAAILRLPGW
jgi:hypothetical protein